jgi:outer membrane protein assembly factor BamB
MGNFLVAYGMDGKEVWSQPVEGTEPSSPDEATPVLTQSHCIIATRNPPQVLAFDKGSGRPAWTAPLTELESSSEVWARWHQGDPARVGELWAYDGRGLVGIADRDGSTSVQVKIPPGLVVARLPFATGGWIAVGAGQSSRVGAIRIARRGGQEAVSPTWTREDLKVSPRSVAIDGDRLYAATGEGEIYEVELARGRTVSRRSLPRNADDTGAPASLLARAGMVVAAHETGWVYLSHDSSRPSEVVTLKLDEPIRASLEFSKPDLFVRTARALWCIPVAPEHPGHSDRSR